MPTQSQEKESQADALLTEGKKLLNLSPEGKLREADYTPYTPAEWNKLAKNYIDKCNQFFNDIGKQHLANHVFEQYNPLQHTDSLVVVIFQHIKAIEHISNQRLIFENCDHNQQVFGNYTFTFELNKPKQIRSVSFKGKPLNMRGNVIGKVLYEIVSNSYLNNGWVDLKDNKNIPVETNLSKEVHTLNNKLKEIDNSVERHIINRPNSPKTYKINE